MLRQVCFILLTFFISKVQCSFDIYPKYENTGLNGTKGTTAQISDDQSMICAGFDDGTFKIFDIQINELCSNTSTANSSIIASVWMPTFGPVTADSSGRVVRWSTLCQATIQSTFTDPIISIGFLQTIDSKTGIMSGAIALNYGSWIQEYDVITFTQLIRYDAIGNETFLDFLYYNDGTNDMLIASTSGSRIRIMSKQDGSQTSSFDIASPIKMMTNIEGNSGNQILGVGQDNNVYRFNSAGNPLSLGTFEPSTSIAFCPTTKQFALAWTKKQNIGVYLYSGNQQKSLTRLQGFSTQIDCSKSYLVSIDDMGFINVYIYEQFKTWIIGVIVGIAVGLILLVVGVVVFIRLRRKWATQADKEKYITGKPKKYPRKINNMNKNVSMNMLQNMTLQTSMRQ